jgi:drug/metabolite transporter (DMT)-like permease
VALRWRLLLLLACFLWAISFIATKIALETTPPLTVATLRLVLAAFCFGLWLGIRGAKLGLGGARWWGELFLLSLIGMGHYAVQTLGLQWAAASNASLYVVTGPISIILLGAIFLGERITVRKAVGILVAVVGVLIVMGFDTLLAFELQSRMLGDALVLASIVMWGIFTVFGKKMTDSLGALALTGVTTIMGAIWMLPVGWLALERRGLTVAAIGLRGWTAIAFLGIGCSFLATLFYFIALQHSESQKVGVYLYTIPPMTTLFAALFLGESIGLGLIIGAALVFAGVYMTEKG